MKSIICAIVIGALFAQSLGAPVDNTENAKNTQYEQSKYDTHGDEDVVKYRQASPKSYGPAPSYGAPAAPAYAPAPAPAYAPAPSYGPAPQSYSYPSPVPTVPCGKNLLFSCQPSVAPVPCSAPAPSASYAASYSEPVPQWVYPVVRGVY